MQNKLIATIEGVGEARKEIAQEMFAGLKKFCLQFGINVQLPD